MKSLFLILKPPPQAYLFNLRKLLVAQLCMRLCDPRAPYVAHQAPLSLGFSRQEYWSGLPCLSPGDLPNPEFERKSPTLVQILYRLSHQGKPFSSSSAVRICEYRGTLLAQVPVCCTALWAIAAILHSRSRTWSPCFKRESVSHPVLSDSLQPRGAQSARLFCPWDSPGKNA